MMPTAERENSQVSDLPPPPPPTAASPEGSSAGVDSSQDSAEEWTWERATDLVKQWYSPLGERHCWYSLAYLGVSAFMAPIMLVAAVALAGITFGLTFVFMLGLLLVIPFFKVVSSFVNFSAWLANETEQSLVVTEPADPGPIRFRAIKFVLTDTQRWRQVGFLAANTVLAAVFFALGSVPISIAWQAFFDDISFITPFSFGTDRILGVAVGAFMVGVFPRVVIPVANAKLRLDQWFVGSGRLAIAEQRVSTLSSQRNEILDAVAGERRRIERNLHDGVQQQLVAIGLDLGMAETKIDADPERAKELIISARTKVQGSIGELRQLGRGLHPAILEDRGIDAALSAIVAGAPIPISVHVDTDLDLSTDVEETIYFMANEAIANILKHASAGVASIHVMSFGSDVRVIINDNGVGGAAAGTGTGIQGMNARVHAVDGMIGITSPTGGPTTIDARIPVR